MHFLIAQNCIYLNCLQSTFSQQKEVFKCKYDSTFAQNIFCNWIHYKTVFNSITIKCYLKQKTLNEHLKCSSKIRFNKKYL